METSLSSTCTVTPLKSSFEQFLLGAPSCVVDEFFEVWPAHLILRLRQLNSTCFHAVESYVCRVWTVRRVTSRWFERTKTFLALLEKCDGIVSGSAALQLLGRDTFDAGDLDILVPPHGLLRMGRWLKSQGYRYQPSGGKHPLFDAAALSCSSLVTSDRGSPYWEHCQGSFTTFNFYRPGPKCLGDTSPLLHVQIIVTRDDPVTFLVNNFHSSAFMCRMSCHAVNGHVSAGVMNYFTGTYAVSLFPRSTFSERHMYVTQDTTHNVSAHAAWMKKYMSRGFTIGTVVDSSHYTHEMRAWKRLVGDSYTWVLPFKRCGECQRCNASSCDQLGTRNPRQASNHASKDTVRSFVFQIWYCAGRCGSACWSAVCIQVITLSTSYMTYPDPCLSSMAFIANTLDIYQYRSNETRAAFGHPLMPLEEDTESAEDSDMDSE